MATKLYTKASSDFNLPIALLENSACFQSASNIPMITWPNGSWCFPANVYMLDLWKNGRSRVGAGGTLLSYAANVSHIIRFCASNSIDFIQMTDSYFTLFIKSLIPPQNHLHVKRNSRNMNTIINIGRNSLDLLATAGRLAGLHDFVGEDGVVRAVKTAYSSTRTRGRYRKNSWYHHSFPMPDAVKKRLPVSDAAHKSLMQAAASTADIFIRKRRFIMLHLLECTGCRRSELVSITIQDIMSLEGQKHPMLRVLTAKKRANEVNYRLIPIATPDVAIFLEYITKNRAPVIRRTLGLVKDHCKLLVSKTTGAPLTANTITQEIKLLAKNSPLEITISPHMYRHRFITKLFIHLIRQHSFDNEDTFRRALLSTEAVKQQVQQWTGHASTESLNSYIHLAFAEFIGFTDTVSATLERKNLHSFGNILHQLSLEVGNGMPADEIIRAIDKIADSLANI